METKDLKIGNWYLRKGVEFKMTNDQLHEIIDIGGEYDYSPIPLNEEWLLKFGFKKRVIENPDTHRIFVDFTLDHESFGLCTMEWDGNNNCVYLCFEGTQCGIDIKHVHQLQNLYFALTGEELVIIAI